MIIDHEPFDLDAEIGAAMRESIRRGPAHREKAEESLGCVSAGMGGRVQAALPGGEGRGVMGAWTPGPWKWWTSNSWRRLKRDDRGISQSVLEPFVARDGHPDCSISDADMALIAAAPDLAEALERALMPMHDAAFFLSDSADDAERSVGAMLWSAYEAARAALAKARGE